MVSRMVTEYVFSGAPDASIGTLTISGGLLGSNPANDITIQNFNLTAAATTSAGFMGINLAYTLSLTGSSVFAAGGKQSYTLSTDAPSGTAETILLNLIGANSADFEVQVGNTTEQINPSGDFTVALPVGDTNVSFTLIDDTSNNGTSDIAGGTTLTLSASVQNPANPSGSAIQSSPAQYYLYTPAPRYRDADCSWGFHHR